MGGERRDGFNPTSMVRLDGEEGRDNGFGQGGMESRGNAEREAWVD